MELYIPWRELYEVADNFGGIGLARDISALICRVRQDRPWLFQVANNSGGLGLGINPLVSNFMWSRICSLFPPNPNDAPCEQFFGGQCEDVVYTIKIFDGNGQEVGTTVPPVNSAVGPLTCINTRIGPENFLLDNPPIPTSFSVSGIGKNGPWSRSTSTKIATPRRDTRLFTYQIVPPPGVDDNCGNAPITINVPPVPPSNSITFETTIFGQRRNVTVNLPTLETGNWPDFEWTPIIEFEGITVEFDTEGMNINLPDNIPLFPSNPTNNTVNQINNNLNNIGGSVNNINNEIQNVSSTVNSISQSVNLIEQILNQKFDELNGQLELDIQSILDAIERCCCKEGVTLGQQVVVGSTAGGRFPLPPKTVALVFDLSLPATPATRLQEGSGGAERVYHWGSYSVGYGEPGEGDRIPLQWAKQCVAVQPYATSVTLWPTYENTGGITAIFEETF